MHRRALFLLIGIAAVMGGLAIFVSQAYDKRLIDPEGNFLGPSYVRLPMLLAGALVLDMVPRVIWYSKLRPAAMPGIVAERWRTHWNRERLTLVASGICCFYIVYVSYRNLKSFLPAVTDRQYDRELHIMDRALFFGHEPATVIHNLLGTNVSAYFLSYVYLWFLPLVPLALTAWMVWARKLSYGYWFSTSQCIAWTLGTASYYALPTIGPGLNYVALYQELPDTAAGSLMGALVHGRHFVLFSNGYEGVQSVAGFASLHSAITLLMALMVQHTLRNKVLKIVFWVNFAITLVATIYFGWHYIADDIAGIAIALVSFYLGGLVSGQTFRPKPQLPAVEEPAPEAAASEADQDRVRVPAQVD